MHKTLSRDEKLDQIMRLREYQQNNSNHVNTMAGIVSPSANTDDEIQDKDQTGIPNALFWKLRLVLCLILFGALCMYHFTMEPEEGTFTKNLQSAIKVDYSEKVIDFVKDFTYTLDYEKTSIK
ncbi:MAG: hypothetical protein J6K58_04625 [Lachnospiraceae bacterium]|nr:hypothetical protein [Lachnospiraceae bacterium]